MRRGNNDLMAQDAPYPTGTGGMSGRPPVKIAGAGSLAAIRGFTIPVFVVCAALWFLLSGARPV